MLLIRITAVLAAACFAGRLAIDWLEPGGEHVQRRARIIWTAGAIAMLLHAAAAFQFQHHWSHAAAWEHTREQTQTLTGWNSGHGLYANYLMTAWWLFDASMWWFVTAWPRKHRGWYWATMAAFGFLMFNATAVFGPWYWRPIVAAFAMIIGGMSVIKGRRWIR